MVLTSFSCYVKKLFLSFLQSCCTIRLSESLISGEGYGPKLALGRGNSIKHTGQFKPMRIRLLAISDLATGNYSLRQALLASKTQSKPGSPP